MCMLSTMRDMKNIIDLGKKGAEHVGLESPTPGLVVSGIEPYIDVINRLPVTKIEAETGVGTKKDIEVHTLLLKNPKVFQLMWQAAVYEPIVYARQGNKTAMGILSPNYDTNGDNRLPSIKVLSLARPYPLISEGGELLPDPQMAIMLAGSAHSEGKGSGGHDKPVDQDYEHKLAITGAVSLGRTSITEGGAHVQHAVRDRSSVATGLSNGSLGNLYVPSADTAGFSGYGEPMIYHQDKVGVHDAIYFPKGFMNSEKSFGVHYTDAARIAYGAGLQILFDRKGQQSVNDSISRIAGQA